MRLILARVRQFNWLLITFILIGLGLRLWAIGWGLPYTYHPDERVATVIRILRTGNLNPEFFHWGSLIFYLNATLYLAYFGVGLIGGRFASLSDLPYPDRITMAVGKTSLPEEFLLGRGLTAIFGALSILIVYLICLQLHKGQVSAWAAALFLAVEPVSVRNSQFIRPDILAIFFTLCSLLFALKIVDDPRLRNYVFAGIFAGLSASSKYNAAFIVVAIVAAHFVRFGRDSLWQKEIYVAALSSAIAFFLTTPFAILTPVDFIHSGPLSVQVNLTTMGASATENSFQWYARFLWTTLGVFLLLALVQLAATLLERDKKGIVFWSFPAVYFLFIVRYQVAIETMVLPVIPMLLIGAGLFIVRAYDFALSRWHGSHAWTNVVLASFTIAVALPPFVASAKHNEQLLEPDAREYARRWIETYLPPETRIALEPYAPYVDRHKYVVNGFGWLLDRTPDWYVAQRFEYLIFSSQNPGAGTDEYEAFFARFPVAAEFRKDDIEIRIAKTEAVLPAHRVSARFGDSADVIELIGYDDATWSPSKSLNLKLYWRPLRTTKEPLELETSVIGPDDREVANRRADLFQGMGWQQNVFAIDWTIPMSSDILPGPYHVVARVLQTRYSYNAPAMNWADERLDDVRLGPILVR